MIMSTKESLLAKLTNTPIPKNFTVKELRTLMQKCGCIEIQGGRGSGIKYCDPLSKRCVAFDLPHPGKDLYAYQVKSVILFLKLIGQIPDSEEK